MSHRRGIVRYRITSKTAAVLVSVACLMLGAGSAHGSMQSHDAAKSQLIQVLSDGFGGDGDPSSNPRVVVVVVPERHFQRNELPAVARRFLSQYDNHWLELWLYSDRDQLLDPDDANLFRYFDDRRLGADSKRPWGLVLRLDGSATLRFRERASNEVVSLQLEPTRGVVDSRPPN